MESLIKLIGGNNYDALNRKATKDFYNNCGDGREGVFKMPTIGRISKKHCLLFRALDILMRPTAPHIKRCTNCHLSECNEDDPECPYMRPYRDKAKAQTKSYLVRHPGLKQRMDKKYYSKNKDRILVQKKQYYRKNREKILKKKKKKGYQLKEDSQNLKLLLCWILMSQYLITHSTILGSIYTTQDKDRI